MEALPVGVVILYLLLRAFDGAHQLLRLLVLRGHDVRDAKVCQHDRCHVQHPHAALILQLFPHDRLVVLNCVNVFFVVAQRLHEARVCHVHLVRLVVRAVVRALSQNLLHLLIVLGVPVNLRLGHQRGYVRVQGLVVLGQRFFQSLVVPPLSVLLNLPRQPSELVRVPLHELLEFTIRLLRRGLRQDGRLQKLVHLLG